MTILDVNKIKNKGFVVLNNTINNTWVNKLSQAVDNSFESHKKIQTLHQSDIKSDGVALHVLLSNETFIDFLSYFLSLGITTQLSENFFGAKCILNSMSALNNLPHNPNFSATVHRDLRFYSYPLPVMVNLLIMLDDFTLENGGTYLLPYSQLISEKPTDDQFFENAIQITGKKGDILVFDSNVWHASAPNKTDKGRRAIPMTISRSFLKQLLDYPRAIGYHRMKDFSNELQQFLGYFSRVPSSLDEWYLPEEKRFYKKNQD